MNPKYIIRVATPSDVSVIKTLELAAHISPWSEKLFTDSFGVRNHNFLIESAGEVVGYCFTHFVAGELTLENICVNPNNQRQGIASTLMEHLMDLAVKLKAEEIWLEVRSSNTSAIALYNKFGFDLVGQRKNYYSIPNSSAREDALLMKKTLV